MRSQINLQRERRSDAHAVRSEASTAAGTEIWRARSGEATDLPIRPGDDEIGSRGRGEDRDGDEEERGEAEERRRHVRRPDRVGGNGFAARCGVDRRN
jgi:hypothetical protein